MSVAAAILSLEDRPRAVLYILLMVIVVFVILEIRDFEKSDISLSVEGKSIDLAISRCDPFQWTRGSVAWWMVCTSHDMGNSRVIPFIASIGIIPLSYLLAARITERRICGLFAAVAITVNPVFLIFDSSTLFHQFWVLFLLVSFYFMYRAPVLAGPFFILSLLSKALPVLFYPGIMIFIWKSGFTRNRKVLLYATYTGVTAFVLGYTFLFGQGLFLEPTKITYTPDITAAFNSLYWNLTKFTSHIMVPLLIVLCVWLAKYRRYQTLSMILVIVASIPVLDIFTVYTTFPYRLIPLMVFMNIGISYIIYSRLVKARMRLESIYAP